MRFLSRRKGMTLIEIMMSVMILGLGLLGILSVIPFIEFHSARVVESDYTAAAGTNAIAVIQSHGWEKPANWEQYSNPATLTDDMVVDNFTVPRFFDIIGEHEVDENGFFPIWAIELGLSDEQISKTGLNVIPHVYPTGAYGVIDNSDTFVPPTASVKDVCRAKDDIVVERDENSPSRPQLLLDESEETNQPEFTGAYSWAALMTPIASDPAQSYTEFTFPGNRLIVNNGIPRAEVAMKVDVLVFRGRESLDDYDWIVGDLAGIGGAGYLGGQVNILPRFNAAGSEKAVTAEFEESLSSSTHILLIGPSDQSESNGQAPLFSAWYKISNHHRDGPRFALTLSGPTLPACWLEGADYDRSTDVRAVLFRNLRGVFTQTIPISESE